MPMKDITLIAVSLGLINELLQTQKSHNVSLANKYMDILQYEGCKLRLIDGVVSLIDYNPTYNMISNL